MLNPVIFIKDPIKYDYSQFIISLLPKFINCNRIDLVILSQINESNQLNDILYFYYQLIRNHKDDENDGFMFDYRFEINILFNLSQKKLNQLSLNNWNHGYSINELSLSLSIPITQISNIEIPPIIQSSSNIDNDNGAVTRRYYQQFKTTAVGGTFDHLHDGHKILLSMANFLTSTKLIIGITDENLLINKKFKSQLQNYQNRQNLVIKFINLLIEPEKFFEIYKINDICGPTGYINDIDNLIISQETKSGGEFVNKFRKDHGFKLLDITIIKVIGGGGGGGGDDNGNNVDEKNSWKGKLSSTDIREREYNRLLNQKS